MHHVIWQVLECMVKSYITVTPSGETDYNCIAGYRKKHIMANVYEMCQTRYIWNGSWLWEVSNWIYLEWIMAMRGVKLDISGMAQSYERYQTGYIWNGSQLWEVSNWSYLEWLTAMRGVKLDISGMVHSYERCQTGYIWNGSELWEVSNWSYLEWITAMRGVKLDISGMVHSYERCQTGYILNGLWLRGLSNWSPGRELTLFLLYYECTLATKMYSKHWLNVHQVSFLPTTSQKHAPIH